MFPKDGLIQSLGSRQNLKLPFALGTTIIELIQAVGNVMAAIMSCY